MYLTHAQIHALVGLPGTAGYHIEGHPRDRWDREINGGTIRVSEYERLGQPVYVRADGRVESPAGVDLTHALSPCECRNEREEARA